MIELHEKLRTAARAAAKTRLATNPIHVSAEHIQVVRSDPAGAAVYMTGGPTLLVTESPATVRELRVRWLESQNRHMARCIADANEGADR